MPGSKNPRNFCDIQCFDLFVFPSLNEGLGSVLFDVMQSNVPIIASDIGGIPDIIQNEKNGILVPIKESEAIYNAIIRLYNDEALRKKFANEAFKNICRHVGGGWMSR